MLNTHTYMYVPVCMYKCICIYFAIVTLSSLKRCAIKIVTSPYEHIQIHNWEGQEVIKISGLFWKFGSGAGTAFVYIAIEAMADGGVAAGLPRDIALGFAAQAVSLFAIILITL